MTDITYDGFHGKRWANFSGDYNPIHFDLLAVAKLNQAALIAHGMRVLADIQNELIYHAGIFSETYSAPIKFSAKFEKPVSCGTKYSLSHNGGEIKTTFKLIDSSTGITHIRGAIFQANYPAFNDVIAERILSKEYQDEAVALWPADIEQNYAVFLSSVMFRELFRAKDWFPADFLNECTPVHSLSALLSQEKVLQTHYDFYCHSSLFYREGQKIEGLCLSIEKPLITGNASYGWLIQVQVTAKEKENTLMQISATLKVAIN
ncbi:hypothetical protein E0L21_14825 [Kosakonia quasisacchari]|uniref:MaoC-like domain-containing protein n=1 Tax=Kosakonia quasisacchari TaxID=2529380 RepID=A0A4R0H6C9_9ENTR|nr:MaoC/PaaZ C-terminal domain-containing protein [Kosakonia quasisacchari]TCC04894.1 hypothetical protein E0L21_14825 [Kosakonia quasisacchari]